MALGVRACMPRLSEPRYLGSIKKYTDLGISDDKAKEELFDILGRDYISGLTLSGGDPLFPGNRAEVLILLKEVREKFPSKTVWCYTGYNYEDIAELEHLKYIDVLVDGKYVESLKDNKYEWAGSTNQRVIDLRRKNK